MTTQKIKKLHLLEYFFIIFFLYSWAMTWIDYFQYKNAHHFQVNITWFATLLSNFYKLFQNVLSAFFLTLCENKYAKIYKHIYLYYQLKNKYLLVSTFPTLKHFGKSISTEFLLLLNNCFKIVLVGKKHLFQLIRNVIIFQPNFLSTELSAWSNNITSVWHWWAPLASIELK